MEENQGKDQLDLLLQEGPGIEDAQRNAAEEAALAAAEPLDEEEAEEEESSVRKLVDALSSEEGEDEDARVNWTLPAVLGGDVLSAKWFRKHALFFIFVFVLVILYVTNRYKSQQQMITIDSLKTTLLDKRLDASTRSSQLKEKYRPSYIEKSLEEMGDTTLGKNTDQPFELKLR